ncbi:MAG: DegT/DnrJ/EryC1/StrS family aminotransferase [Bacteroidales bacterium]|nr:DegT/DnrJ/EryC1/StrS family aminotransferase [Bacteroidales bacterium]
MKEIRMVDLHGQYLKIKSEVNEAIQKVIDSTAFIRGGDVRSFEDELSVYMGVPHAIACGNGTDALQVAMMALGLQPGDEVITTPFTFIATIEVIKLLGLKPVLVDVKEDTFNLDPELLQQVVTDRTRAMVPVHLFGQCADMDRIMDFARQTGIYVIEDNAQAIGADHTSVDSTTLKAGTIGHIGTTSFFPSKNLGAFGDGGALFTRDESFGNMLRSLVNHGMSRERYHYDQVGVNSRLDTLQAAILRVKLKHLDKYHAARQQAAAYYDNALSGIGSLQIPVRSPFSTHIFHQYTLQVPPGQRDSLKQWLQEKKIPAMIYYPVPLHLQPAYKDLGYHTGDLPVSEKLSGRVLSLPMHTELEEEQLAHICEQIQSFFNS